MALPTWLQGLWVPSGLQRGVSAVLLMIICNFLLFKFSVLGRAWHSCRVYVGSSGCCCLGCCRAAATAGVAEAQVVLVLSSWSPAWGPAFGHWARNYQNYFEHTARNGLCRCQQPLHVRWTNMRKARSEGSEGETWIPGDIRSSAAPLDSPFRLFIPFCCLQWEPCPCPPCPSFSPGRACWAGISNTEAEQKAVGRGCTWGVVTWFLVYSSWHWMPEKHESMPKMEEL